MGRRGTAGSARALALGLTLFALGSAGGGRAVASDAEAVEAAERNVRGEIGQAFEKIVRKKKRKCQGDYNFLRAVVCWNAARAAQRDEAWPIAQMLFNEAHEQLTIFFARNGKKLRQDAGDRARDRVAEKSEKKMRIARYDAYLEAMERIVPSFAAFVSARDWTAVPDAVQLPLPAEDDRDENGKR